MKAALALLLLVVLSFNAALSKPTKRTYPGVKLIVNTETNKIQDEDGRERYFHGTNVVYKRAPFYPKTDAFDAQFSFADEDMQLMKDMGYNVIRLGAIWAAAEPTKDNFDSTWYNKVTEIINKAGSEYGIYSLLDGHQDAWSQKFCGAGVPDYVAAVGGTNFPVPLQLTPIPVDPKTGYPNRTTCDSINNNNWPMYQFTTAINTAVGDLYSNVNGLADRFANFWAKNAAVWGKNQYVVGYELLNEPWCGNVYTQPQLLIPGFADRQTLGPLYDRVNAAIRPFDPDHLIFFQGVTWEILGFGEKYGFEHVPGGNDYRNRSVLAFHNSIAEDLDPEKNYYPYKAEEMQRLGCAAWVTETGTPQLDIADQFGFSWMHWDYKWYANITWDNPGIWKTNGSYLPCTGGVDDCLDVAAATGYSRVYPQAIAGRQSTYSFDSTANVFRLTYTIEPSCTLPTEIAVPTRFRYPAGFQVNIIPANLATWVPGDWNVIHIVHTPPVQARNITVMIAPIGASVLS